MICIACEFLITFNTVPNSLCSSFYFTSAKWARLSFSLDSFDCRESFFYLSVACAKSSCCADFFLFGCHVNKYLIKRWFLNYSVFHFGILNCFRRNLRDSTMKWGCQDLNLDRKVPNLEFYQVILQPHQ